MSAPHEFTQEEQLIFKRRLLALNRKKKEMADFNIEMNRNELARIEPNIKRLNDEIKTLEKAPYDRKTGWKAAQSF